MGRAAQYITRDAMAQIIEKMMSENALIMRIAVHTGIRITDVLNLRIGDVRQNKRVSIVEHKTSKRKEIYIPAQLRREILATREIGQHDGYYVFPGRVHPLTCHRTRQAVYKDIQRAITLSGLDVHCSPHTARKIYAVDKMRELKDIDAVGKLLNHTHRSTTMIYALADLL